MVEEVFRDIPHVELLQWFARGSLKQNLSRSIRLWVWLRSLYGEPTERVALNLDEGFTYAQWRDLFFTFTHTKKEEVSQHKDLNCPCTKTTADWLFNSQTGIIQTQWELDLVSHAGIDESKLNKLLQGRLFGVTRRSLQADLQILGDLGWLVYKNQKYYGVKKYPLRPQSINNQLNIDKFNAYEFNFLHEDLVAIAQNHSQKINDIQRFFVHLDYVIPKSTIDLVENWQWELKELWTKEPVLPIKLTYNSAKIIDIVDCIVFPVCIYYMQRAVYLCAYGESPKRETSWYNFRLDRVQKITLLDWKHGNLPVNLQKRYQTGNLPTPDYVALEMTKAWGFDFYLPSQLMLLRFDRDFAERYVKGTERHETFEEITYPQARRLIQKQLQNSSQQQTLLKVLANRSSEDVYYQVFIRYQDSLHRDNNIIMRLRAWRPRCEVIFPFDLRQNIAADIAEEFQLYHQDFREL
ncbi:MAG: TIGR03985 family CRISPR-associated protein [Cyanobacteria bacterium P01_A01_bin.84]